MKSKKSLINVLMVSMLSMISLPIVILGAIFVVGDYYFFHQDRLELKKSYMQEQSAVFKEEVDRAVDHLEWRFHVQKVPEPQLKKEIMDWFSTIRFQNRGREPGCLFIGSFDGHYLLDEIRPLSAVGGGPAAGRPVQQSAHKAFMKAVLHPKGEFVNYALLNPATGGTSNRKAFVRAVPQFEWYVGAGFSLDELDSIITRKKQELKVTIQQHVTTAVLLLVAMILLQYLIYRVMLRKIVAGFNSFSDFFRSAEKNIAEVRRQSLHFSEFENLAESADKMIGERCRAENALRESEARYRSIIENVEEGYCEVDTRGRIVFTNDSLNEILGYTGEELLAMDGKELLPAEESERVLKYFAGVYQSEKAPSEYIFPVLGKDGAHKHIEVTPSVIKDAEGRKIGLRSIVRDVEQRKKYEENLIYLAYHDALTGLKNRKAFYEQLQNAVYHAKRYGIEIGLIYIDIDHFKKVNDTLGHEMGDLLLQEIKNRLQGCLRKTDFISRIGGDEFVIILDNPTKIHPSVVARKIVESLSRPYALNGHTVDYVTASVGISTFPTDAENMESLIKKADKAMYKAKEQRNRYFEYSDMP